MGSQIAEAGEGRKKKETTKLVGDKKEKQHAETKHAGATKRNNRCDESKSPEDTRIIKKTKTYSDRRDETHSFRDYETHAPGRLAERHETCPNRWDETPRIRHETSPNTLQETSPNRWNETCTPWTWDEPSPNTLHETNPNNETPTPWTWHETSPNTLHESSPNRWDESPTPRILHETSPNRWDETPTPKTLHETSDSDRRNETSPVWEKETNTPGRLECSNRWYETPPPNATWDKTPDSDRDGDSASSGGSDLSNWCYSLTPDWQDETPTTEDGATFDLNDLHIPAILPFLKAVCHRKDSWQARHKGIGFVQQIAILMGRALFPHLSSIVEIIEPGLNDKYEMVRTGTALLLAALAKASAPCGIISFEPVLKPLLKGIRSRYGGDLDAFWKAIGSMIPLMDAVQARYYTKKVMVLLKRDFNRSCNEARRKIVLKVVKRCVSTEGVETDYIHRYILPELFRCFWVGQPAYLHSKQLVETTFEIAKKVGVADVVGRIAEDLKYESEPYRIVVMEAIEKIVANLGLTDIDARLEERLIDGIRYAFEKQDHYDSNNVVLNGFGVVVNLLGQRMKPYLPQVCATITRCLKKDSAHVRRSASDLISRIAVVLKQCEAQEFVGDLGVSLYENLAEECPKALGSILGALKAVVNVSDATKMTPPIKNLLQRLTPILKNRHEKEVQENCIELVSLIDDML